MGLKSTTAIDTVKQEIQLQEWAAQIQARQESGMTVKQWCAENGMNDKTYYYRLRRVREQYVDSVPSIVSLPLPERSGEIRIEKSGMHISLPADISSETLLALVHELC